MPRGRQRSVVWECFVKHPTSSKRRVLCRFCNHDTVAFPSRMVRHIVKKCPRVDDKHKRICARYARQTGDNGSDSNSNSDGQVQQTTPPAQTHSSGGGALVHAAMEAPSLAVSRATEGQPMDQVNEELVLALLTEGVSWHMLENSHLQTALRLLRPDFQPVVARVAESEVLPRLCLTARSHAAALVQDARVLTFVCRITSDQKRRSQTQWLVVNQLAQSALLLQQSDVPVEYPHEVVKCVSDFMATQTLSPRTIVHFCGDSVGPAWHARTALRYTTRPVQFLLLGGCVVQQTLLVLQDMLTTLTCIDLAVEKCMEVIDLVRSSMELARAVPLALPTPHPSDLRTLLECINCVLCHKAVILETQDSSTSACSIRQALAEIVTDDMFWMCLNHARELLQPLVYVMALSEVGDASSGRLLACWLWLFGLVNSSDVLLDSDKESLNVKLVDRVRLHLEDHMFACLVLDPRIHGAGLSPHGKRKAKLIIADLGARINPGANRFQLIDQLFKYMTKDRPFDDEESWALMAAMPRLFWTEYATEAPELAAVALAVLGYRCYLQSMEETMETLDQSHSISPLPLAVAQVRHYHAHRHWDPECAAKQVAAKYYSCFQALVPAATCPSSQVASSPSASRAIQPPKASCAAAFKRIKTLLPRLNEPAQGAPTRSDLDSSSSSGAIEASLQRFDTEWVDVSAASAVAVHAHVAMCLPSHVPAGDDDPLDRRVTADDVTSRVV
ncbi:TPA: hypothetical protein N0F65_003134 [Lagenidium giganteum]|uniref:BED-type domain-containing protein n=1 Tax=Lagenidium giganteum TaxID=4803 RepID=A0AAV2YF68_9STRA|nr:TPA: hypothetical protein N0F65_003134 [Lagenidium giganteum]